MKKATVVAILLLVAYAAWTRTGRDAPAGPSQLRLEDAASFGRDQGAGNLVGVQPYMTASDYATEERFTRKLEAYLDAAGSRGWLGPRTVVVFPEYVGTWLVALGEKRGTYEARTASAALRLVAASNPLALARAVASAQGSDRLTDAVFRMKAEAMAAVYTRAFAHAAARYGVTIVAGSVLLPEPRVEGSRLRPGEGPLRNVCAVFRPDGSLHDRLAAKAFPIAAEKPFVAAASLESLPVYETPAGRLGVLICADSWYPQAYEVLRARGVRIVAVPSYATGSGSWQRPWPGYDGAPAPADVDPRDRGRLTEAEAWDRYALAGRISASGAAAGVNVFLRGVLWDLGGDGRSYAVAGGVVLRAPEADGAALLNLWLPGPPGS